MTDNLTLQAITILKSGNKQKARELFASAIKQNPDNELAWSWVFTLVDTDEQRIHCLKEVIRINSSNIQARQALDKLEAKYIQSPDFEDYIRMDREPGTPHLIVKVKNPAPLTFVNSTQIHPPSESVQPAQNIFIPTDRKPEIPHVSVKVENPALLTFIDNTRVKPPVESVQSIAVNRTSYREDSLSSKFTPKRIITAIGLLLIIASAFATWSIKTYGYDGWTENGAETTEGLIAAASASLGFILLFATDSEKKAHMLSSLLAVIALIAAFSYLGNANYYERNSMYSARSTSEAGTGIYMSIFGAAITLGCFLIPASDRDSGNDSNNEEVRTTNIRNLNTLDTKENSSQLTYRQRFAITEYGYLLSPQDAETVGKMLGSVVREKDILPFCQANGKRVSGELAISSSNQLNAKQAKGSINLQQELSEVELAIANGDKKNAALLMDIILKKDFTNPETWQFLYKLLGTGMEFPTFQKEFVSKHYSDKLHLFQNTESAQPTQDSHMKSSQEVFMKNSTSEDGKNEQRPNKQPWWVILLAVVAGITLSLIALSLLQ
ncbi:MAG: hypothetical protein KA318_07940 [Nitrosomonas sp.]|nr:hypothetical protein [Nitrosomonas sp.]